MGSLTNEQPVSQDCLTVKHIGNKVEVSDVCLDITLSTAINRIKVGDFYVNYNEVAGPGSGNAARAVWGGGNLTATLSPTMAALESPVTSGVLSLYLPSSPRTGHESWIRYNSAGNHIGLQQGAIRLTYIPQYNDNPPTVGGNLHLFQSHRGVWGVGQNIIWLEHLSGGELNLYIEGESSTIINWVDFGFWNAEQTRRYEFELNYDLTNGATRLFIDGIQFGPTLTETGTRGPVNLITIGADESEGQSLFAIDDLVIFDTVQHTENYTPGQSIPASQYIDSQGQPVG